MSGTNAVSDGSETLLGTRFRCCLDCESLIWGFVRRRVGVCALNLGSQGAVVAYVRTVKAASGAIAVQIVWSSRRGSHRNEHLGSVHDEAEVAALKAAAQQQLAGGQGALDRRLDATGTGGSPLEIVSSRAGHLCEARCRAYQALGFDRALDGDEGLRDLVLARIIEPTSKADALRVLAETGVESVSYRTVTRRLPLIAKPVVRHALSAACAAHAGLGPASDYQACSDKEPDPLQRREFLRSGVHPGLDYPTLPAYPGWPAAGAA